MDLITSLSPFQMIASIPLLVMLVPVLLDFYKSLIVNPIVVAAVNTTLVILKNTELVWRPALQFAIAIIKPIIKALINLSPHVKSLVILVFNQTVQAFWTVQKMGMGLVTSVSNFVDGLGELGTSLIVMTRGIGNVGYYLIRTVGGVIGSFNTVFTFSKRLLFEAHLITADDVYNVAMPFFIVVSVILAVIWLRKGPSPQKSVETFQPRRSSRIARKRSMFYAADISDALPPCKKSSATSSNL